jgi:hypothetical protein
VSTILDVKADYRGDQDSVQAIVVLADSVDGRSLHDRLVSAHCDLLYYGHVVASQEFTAEAYIYPTDLSSGDLGEFRISFLHPPLRRELEVLVEATLGSGDEVRVIRPVEAKRDPDTAVDLTNPLLDSKQPLTYPKLAGVDYDRHQ